MRCVSSFLNAGGSTDAYSEVNCRNIVNAFGGTMLQGTPLTSAVGDLGEWSCERGVVTNENDLTAVKEEYRFAADRRGEEESIPTCDVSLVKVTSGGEPRCYLVSRPPPRVLTNRLTLRNQIYNVKITHMSSASSCQSRPVRHRIDPCKWPVGSTSNDMCKDLAESNLR